MWGLDVLPQHHFAQTIFHPLGNQGPSKPLLLSSPLKNDPGKLQNHSCFSGLKAGPSCPGREPSGASQQLCLVSYGAEPCKNMKIWDGKLLQAGNDHKLAALPVNWFWCTGGAHVSFPFCSDLMHNRSDCSEKPLLRNGGAGAPIFTHQIEIVSSLFFI